MNYPAHSVDDVISHESERCGKNTGVKSEKDRNGDVSLVLHNGEIILGREKYIENA